MPRQFANGNLYDVVKTLGNTSIEPSEVLTDPVGKMRVSTPQALIDTDFEYGTQSTKWETLNLLNNRPSAFYDVTRPLTITAVSAASTTVTVSTATPPAVGTPIFVQDTTSPAANGWWIVDTISAGVSFTYITNTAPTAGSIYDATKTYVFSASFYSGAGIPLSTVAGQAFTNVISPFTTVTCTTTHAHGLTVGDAIYVVGTTATTNQPNGSWVVKTTPTVNTFTFTVLNAPTGTITATAATATLYPRPYGSVIHRSFDGGVSFTTGYPYSGNQLIRQTRRYFRYQSGKGMQFSTGTCLKPAFNIDSVTSSGTTVTVTLKFPHNMGAGAFIQVSGSSDSAYNGIFPVLTAPTDLTFTYKANATPTVTTVTDFPITISPYSWYGSKNRIGLFDEQNGFFFEFDGQTLYAVKRSSTTQLSGTIAVNAGSPTVTGTNTAFSTQLNPGDYIVIRGMSYVVQCINSNTSLNIYPEYRATANISNCIISKRIEERYAQDTWNLDRCDGNGPTKFTLDLTKMQMMYIDYAWYGAGAIRFGFKDQNGKIIYCHRISNSNRNTEAYMRSGNIPARYECNLLTSRTILKANATASAANITVADTSSFPSSGTLCLTRPGNTGSVIEYASYTGKTATTFTGLTRGITNLTGPGGLTGGGGGAAAAFTYSATAPIDVSLFPAQFASTLSHWGSAVIMDGRYDDDKSYVFQAGMTTAFSNVGASASVVLLSIRLAPSVDSGQTGILGARDLINRMQLTLRQMDIFSTGITAFRIELILNGRLSADSFASAGGSSLAQVCLHTNTTTVTGGESIFSFFTTTPGVTQQDLGLVRDLGTNILGGGTVLTAPTTALNLYPDGPDIITVKATNVTTTTTNTIAARLSWTEAQA